MSVCMCECVCLCMWNCVSLNFYVREYVYLSGLYTFVCVCVRVVHSQNLSNVVQTLVIARQPFFFLLLQSLFRPVIRMISNVFCISQERFEDNFICVIVMTYSHTVLHIFPSSVELAENTASQRRCSLGFPCVMPQDAILSRFHSSGKYAFIICSAFIS